MRSRLSPQSHPGRCASFRCGFAVARSHPLRCSTSATMRHRRDFSGLERVCQPAGASGPQSCGLSSTQLRMRVQMTTSHGTSGATGIEVGTSADSEAHTKDTYRRLLTKRKVSRNQPVCSAYSSLSSFGKTRTSETAIRQPLCIMLVCEDHSLASPLPMQRVWRLS